VNDAATVMGRPKDLEVGPDTYKLYPLDFDDHGDIQIWLDDQIRNPMDLVRKEITRGGLPMEVQRYMVEAALKVWARSKILVGTPEADELLNTIRGRAQLMYLSVRKGNPRFTFDDAMGVLRRMDEMARAEAMRAADVLRADRDPKAGPTNGSTATTPSPELLSTGMAGSAS
jgi:hypothetical protein